MAECSAPLQISQVPVFPQPRSWVCAGSSRAAGIELDDQGWEKLPLHVEMEMLQQAAGGADGVLLPQCKRNIGQPVDTARCNIDRQDRGTSLDLIWGCLAGMVGLQAEDKPRERTWKEARPAPEQPVEEPSLPAAAQG